MTKPRTLDAFRKDAQELADATEQGLAIAQAPSSIEPPAPPGEATAANVDVDADAETPSRVERPLSYKRTTEEQKIALFAAIEAGQTVRSSAKAIGLSLRTAFDVLARGDDDIEHTRLAFRKLLQLEALDRLDNWREASKVGASKKGNHVPARDWLLHAGVIDSLDGDRNGVRVSITIGTDDRPMRIPSPLQVLEHKDDSD